MSLTGVLPILLSILIFTVKSEHPGAYSSPQYAKKMYPMNDYDTNSLLPRKPPGIFKQNFEDRMDVGNDTAHYARSSFLDSAGSFLSGTGGQMMTSMAKNFIARSTGSSQVGFDCIAQVLSLNLTNLVILVVLKALILAAGFFGAGALKGGHGGYSGYGRSLDDNKNAEYITEDEILMYLSYLTGQQSQDYGCLYRLSCKRPRQAGLYSSGADLLLQGTKLVRGNSTDLMEYEEIANGLRNAAAWGEAGMPCDNRYPCGD